MRVCSLVSGMVLWLAATGVARSAAIDLRVYFAGANLSLFPSGDWNRVSLPNPNSTQILASLVDFESGLPTDVAITLNGWEDRFGSGVWPEQVDIDWTQPNAVEGGWFFDDNDRATISFSGLEDVPHRFEFVAARGTLSRQTITVNGQTTASNFQNNSSDSIGYDPRREGFDDRNWLIWDDVVPDAGVLSIEVAKDDVRGVVNALRLSAIPEPSSISLLVIAATFCLRRRRC